MLKTKILLGFLLIATVFVACQKKEAYDREKQMDIDDAIIVKYLTDSSVVAEKHSTGLYYHIINEGEGNVTFSDTTQINALYTGKILNGPVFDKSTDSTFKFFLPEVIEGWQTGIRLIKPGGEIRLIIPSPLGYQFRALPGIPANSILDFTIKILIPKK